MFKFNLKPSSEKSLVKILKLKSFNRKFYKNTYNLKPHAQKLPSIKFKKLPLYILSTALKVKTPIESLTSRNVQKTQGYEKYK